LSPHHHGKASDSYRTVLGLLTEIEKLSTTIPTVEEGQAQVKSLRSAAARLQAELAIAQEGLTKLLPVRSQQQKVEKYSPRPIMSLRPTCKLLAMYRKIKYHSSANEPLRR